MTVSQVLDFWNEQRQKKGKAKLFTNRVYEFMGDVPANTMTAKLCRDYTEWRQTNIVSGFGWKKSSFKKPSLTTPQRELAYLRSATNLCINEGLLIQGAVFDIENTETYKDRPTFTKEQARAFTDIATWHLKLFLVIAFQSGHRMRAVLDLTWDRINFSERTIDFNKVNVRQSHKKRGVMFFKADSELERLLNIAWARKTCDYVIEYNSSGIKNIRRSWDRHLEVLQREHNSWNLRGLTPHCTKHTAILWMIKEKVPFATISLATATDIKTLIKYYASVDAGISLEAVNATEF